MKIYCILFYTLFCSFTTMSQSKGDIDAAEKSAVESLNYFKGKNYMSAYNSLLKAETETKKVIDERLKNALPEKIDNWKLQDENMMNMLMISSSNTKIQTGFTSINLYLELPENNKENIVNTPSINSSRIIVTFSSNPNIITAVTAIHKGDAEYLKNVKSGSKTKPMKIKEYLAYSNYYDTMKLSEVSVVAGTGTVQIEGKGLESIDLLIKIANKIDYSKIIEIFSAQ